MIGAREMNGSQKRSHIPIITVRMASFVLLMMILLPTFGSYVFPLGAVTLETDKRGYAVGETVAFSGSEYSPNGTSYEIRISYDQSTVARLSFLSNDSKIPNGVSWTIPFDAENGTYVADAYNVTGAEKLLVSTEFQVIANATTRLEYLENELAGLKALVISNVTVTGINNSLLASLNNSDSKLESALALFQGGENKTAANQLRAARNMLTAFVHKVLAQYGKKMGNSTALALIEAANDSIVKIDSMVVLAELPLGKKLALNVERTLAKEETHLTTFVISRRLSEANTDEEIIASVNSTEGEMSRILIHTSSRKQMFEGLLANGSVDYVSMLMELQRDNDTSEGVREAAVLLVNELTALNQTRPGLGKHLGGLTHIAKGLVTNSTDVGKGMGELMSKAHSQGNQEKGKEHGGGKGNGNDHSNKKGGR